METFRADITLDELQALFSGRLGRRPEPVDLYEAAKDFYNAGAVAQATRCLELYSTLPGALMPGRHLLGYCYMASGRPSLAINEFKKCVTHEGYDLDWQLLVELQFESDAVTVPPESIASLNPATVRSVTARVALDDDDDDVVLSDDEDPTLPEMRAYQPRVPHPPPPRTSAGVGNAQFLWDESKGAKAVVFE